MSTTFILALIFGGGTFCFIIFGTSDKDWENYKGGREYAAVKYGLFMFLIIAAMAGLGLFSSEP